MLCIRSGMVRAWILKFNIMGLQGSACGIIPFDNNEIWFWIANGQISSIFHRDICLRRSSGRVLSFYVFISSFELNHFLAEVLSKSITMGMLWAQLLVQFYTDQFETLQTLLPWSVDVHVVWALLSISFSSLFIPHRTIMAGYYGFTLEVHPYFISG